MLFEVRDNMQWIYGSGFPKSMNISKAIDKSKGTEKIIGKAIGMGKQNPEWNGTAKGRKENSLKPEYDLTVANSPEAKHWDGWGTALKPAYEPILLVRKPLSEKTIVDNVLKYGTGGINIDESRITMEPSPSIERRKHKTPTGDYNGWKVPSRKGYNDPHSGEERGRYPANVILSHHPDCKMVGYQKVKGVKTGVRKAGSELGQSSDWNSHENKDTVRQGIGDKDGNETIEDWECVEGCPMTMFPETKTGKAINRNRKPELNNKIYGKGRKNDGLDVGFNDSGGSASRFFYCAKASKKERNLGLDNMEKKNASHDGRNKKIENAFQRHENVQSNFHPTVKPVKLMEYLVTLITPKGGVCCDPFAGSGSTLVACKKKGFDYIGIELGAEYIPIIEARLAYYEDDEPGAVTTEPKGLNKFMVKK